jgi:hypothetical protein
MFVCLFVCICLAAGYCDFLDCNCIAYCGKSGTCRRCSHPNLYHQVKVRRVDLIARAAADEAHANRFRRRKLVEQQMAEQKQTEQAATVVQSNTFLNTYPCSVIDCEW